jgi:hypothetical protein
MIKICPSCNNKCSLVLIKSAKSLFVGNQYQCSNCKATIAWDRVSHFLSFLLPILLITPTLLINFLELSNQQTINLYIGFGLASVVLLIFGFYRSYLVVNKS